MAGLPAPPQVLRSGDSATLRQLAQAPNDPAMKLRARIVLLAAEGVPNVEIAERVGASRPTVNLWRRRYALHGVAGLVAERPRKEVTMDARAILLATLQSPPDTQPQWSSRLLGRTLGVSHVTVTRAWREFGIRPSGPDTFTFATEPPITANVTDLLGLYIAPIECAVMLRTTRGQSGDDREPPPSKSRAAAPAVHATELRAALRIAAEHATPWRTPEPETSTLVNFLEVLDRNHPGPETTLVLDNIATTERAAVQNWLTAHPHVNVASTPNLSAWLNLVETWLTLVTIRSTADAGEVLDLMGRVRPLATRSTAQSFVWTKPPAHAHQPTHPPLGNAASTPRRRSATAGLPGPRGFPFVAQAGHTQVAPDRVITYPRVQSRAVVGCHAGRGRVVLNGKDHPLHPGLLYVLPWDHSIEYRPDPRDPFFVFGVHVIPWQLAEQPLRFSAAHDERDQFFGVDWRRPCAPGESDSARKVVVTTEAERPGLAALTRYAIERFLRGLPSPTEGRALGVLAMAELNASSSLRPEEDPALPAGLRGLLVWITRDLSRDLNLTDMAAVLECSPSTLTRQFRRFLGCSPMDWVIGQRIELAQQMLASGNPTIASVARTCGYDDPEYFSRLFKDRVGSTPREWRHFRTI